jgi:hypothetical protein
MHNDQTQANGSYAQVAADGISEHPNYRFDSTARKWSAAEVSRDERPAAVLKAFAAAPNAPRQAPRPLDDASTPFGTALKGLDAQHAACRWACTRKDDRGLSRPLPGSAEVGTADQHSATVR